LYSRLTDGRLWNSANGRVDLYTIGKNSKTILLFDGIELFNNTYFTYKIRRYNVYEYENNIILIAYSFYIYLNIFTPITYFLLLYHDLLDYNEIEITRYIFKPIRNVYRYPLIYCARLM